MSFVFHVADTKTAKPGAQVRRIGPAAVAEGGTEKQREGNQRGRTGGAGGLPGDYFFHRR